MMRRVAWLGLAVSATLFVAWLGFLGYLVLTDARPTVVSYPQLLASSAEIVTHIEPEADGQLPRTVTVKEVLRGQVPGPTIAVANLPESVGYVGPGDYLVPLVPVGGAGGGKEFRVPRPARSPGSELGKNAPEAMIYPWNKAVQQQYHDYYGQ